MCKLLHTRCAWSLIVTLLLHPLVKAALTKAPFEGMCPGRITGLDPRSRHSEGAALIASAFTRRHAKASGRPRLRTRQTREPLPNVPGAATHTR